MPPVTSRHLVDPGLHELLDSFQPIALSKNRLADVRAALPAEAVREGVDGDIDVEDLHVPGMEGAPDVRILVYRPLASDRPAAGLLHIHGGGFVLGSADRSDVANRGLARALNCVIVSVDYRLAPETRFPGAVEDCLAALCWMHASTDRLRVDSKRIGVIGESAGGGLAAALALMARDRGGPAIAFQHLVFPMLDDRTCINTGANPFAGEFIWTSADNRFGWTSLLGEAPGGEAVSPYAAPARAAVLSGLPPVFIAVGSLDLFLDENLAYAQRLARAGVPIELHVYPGAFHAFQMAPGAAVTRQANADSLAGLRRAIAKG